MTFAQVYDAARCLLPEEHISVTGTTLDGPGLTIYLDPADRTAWYLDDGEDYDPRAELGSHHSPAAIPTRVPDTDDLHRLLSEAAHRANLLS
jgi:2-C-methyl-D-erythritol 4-phosphate cytidylyltransferase